MRDWLLKFIGLVHVPLLAFGIPFLINEINSGSLLSETHPWKVFSTCISDSFN